MKTLVYTFLFLIFISCSSDNQDFEKNKIYSKWVDVKLDFARNFKLQRNLDDSTTFKVSIINPFINDTITYITAENKRSLVMMANNIGFFSALNLQDNIIAVSRFKYIYDSILNSKIAADMLIEVGDMVSINKELVYSSSPDYIISSGFQTTYADLIWLPSNIKALITYEWLEKHPLATLEWIKVYGALFGEYEKSEKYFSQLKNNYTSLKNENVSDSKNSILSGSLYGDIWYTPGGESYKGVLYADANIAYHFADDTTTGSIPLSIEEVINYQNDADFWCSSLEVKSLKDLKKMNPIYKEFNCVKKGRVYLSNKLMNNKNINGFWEQYQVRPDLYLNDMISITNDLDTNLYFFKKLD